MRLLLDTHALVWWWTDDRRLPEKARAAVAAPANTILVSAASMWEIATKHRLGKWPEVEALIARFDASLRRSRFVPLMVTITHARVAGGLDHPHRDPFDRMLAAQALSDDASIVSGDPVFASFGVGVVWACPLLERFQADRKRSARSSSLFWHVIHTLVRAAQRDHALVPRLRPPGSFRYAACRQVAGTGRHTRREHGAGRACPGPGSPC